MTERDTLREKVARIVAPLAFHVPDKYKGRYRDAALVKADSILSLIASEVEGVLEPFARVHEELAGNGLNYSICDESGTRIVDDPDFEKAAALLTTLRAARGEGNG